MAQVSYSDSIKLVVFNLYKEEFGIEITKINGIIRKDIITTIPYAADFIEGIINYRGRPLVVIDLRKRFGLAESIHEEEDQRIIVLDFHPFLVGMLVDHVSEVLTIPFTNIEPVPENLISLEIEQEYLLGVGNINKGERLIILLDLSKVFSDDELEQLGLIFNHEQDIRTYLIENQKKKEKDEEDIRINQSQKNYSLTSEANSTRYNENEVSNEEYERIERQMIRKLALRDIQQEFGVELSADKFSEDEVVFVEDLDKLEQDEDVEYVYMDEDGNELSAEEVRQLQLDEKAEQKSDSEPNRKSPLVEEEPPLEPELSNKCIKTYEKHLTSLTKADLYDFSRKYSEMKVETRMKKKVMIDTILDFLISHDREKIANYIPKKKKK